MVHDVDSIHQMILSEVPDTYKKAPGFPAWDFTKAFAMAIHSLSLDVDAVLERMDISNLKGGDLDTYALQHRGLLRRYGDYAEATLMVTSGEGNIYAGDLFSTATGIQFVAVSDYEGVSTGSVFVVRAVEAGDAGNVPANTIQFMPVTINGIQSVNNPAPASGGSDTESDLDFFDRLLYDLQNPSNGANQAAYISWASSVPGVGRAKVFPQAQGLNSVEVCITGSDMLNPSGETVDAVQNYIDPNRNGDGAGVAPIGAICYVTPCTKRNISVSLTLQVSPGYYKADVVSEITQRLRAYFREIAFEKDYLSYAQVSNVIHDTDGVEDFSTLRVNSGTADVSIGARQVPYLTGVTA